jgi:hypothetical protein
LLPSEKDLFSRAGFFPACNRNREIFVSSSPENPARFFKLIACEIAVREFCHAVATTPNIVDLEFLTQGYHDTPAAGRVELQKRIDAVPLGKYDAIILGYGLCSNILTGITTGHTPLVIPRAHDCITFFLGSKERYQEFFEANPGTYYYTSGWLECVRRRAEPGQESKNIFLPAHSHAGVTAAYEQWVKKYGEEKAKYLLEVMGEWTANYTRGALIDFDFTQPLKLGERVGNICRERGWEYAEVKGDLGLFQRLVNGDWREDEVLVLPPGHKVAPAFDGRIVSAESAPGT